MLYKKKISAEKRGGERFGRLLVVEPNCRVIKRNNKKTGAAYKRYYHRCLCDCGKEKEIQVTSLKAGRTLSCGCLHRERTRESHHKHGMSGTRVFKKWAGMFQRCENPNSLKYPRYGGRGIRVCDEWRDFKNFYKDMGDPPEGMTLDRIDNNGNYCKENCRWATSKTQANNQERTIMVKVDGKMRPMTEVARERGLCRQTVYQRLRRDTAKEHPFAAVAPSSRGKNLGVLFEFNGKSLTIAQWAAEIGIPLKTLSNRLAIGMPLERALVLKDKVYGKTYLYKGELLGVTALAKALGISQSTLSGLFKRGVTFEEVLNMHKK